ncbi:MAG: NAD(P)H-hydrate epimerase [Lachnospiraceae bacterium]|nr:NAD(P)H-hydrate epimerase [Lachnospiraceae bacterium]
MEYIVTPEEMKRADEITIQEYGISSLVLMERAALQTMEVLKQEAFDLSRVLVVCGIGNNGGDGLALSRLLIEEGNTPEIVFIGNEEKATTEVREQLEILKALDVEISKELIEYPYTTIVDCLFGISLNRDLEGNYLEVAQRVNRMDTRVLSVDMPSGIHALTGKIMQDAIKADVTVTMQYKKVNVI